LGLLGLQRGITQREKDATELLEKKDKTMKNDEEGNMGYDDDSLEPMPGYGMSPEGLPLAGPKLRRTGGQRGTSKPLIYSGLGQDGARVERVFDWDYRKDDISILTNYTDCKNPLPVIVANYFPGITRKTLGLIAANKSFEYSNTEKRNIAFQPSYNFFVINSHKQFVREIKPRKFLRKVAWVPNKPLKRTIFTFDAAEMRLIEGAMLFDGNFEADPKEAEKVEETPTLKEILEKKKQKKADPEEDWDFAGRKIDIKERAWKLDGEKDSRLANADPENPNASQRSDTNPDTGLLDSPQDPDPEVSQDWDLLGQEQAQTLVQESEDSIDFVENKP
jgi:hypothetical protein